MHDATSLPPQPYFRAIPFNSDHERDWNRWATLHGFQELQDIGLSARDGSGWILPSRYPPDRNGDAHDKATRYFWWLTNRSNDRQRKTAPSVTPYPEARYAGE